MRGYSADVPEQVVQIGGGYQFRYNIEEVTRDTDDGPIAEYRYNFVHVPVLDRRVLIDALITSRYSYAAQLGKLTLDRDSQEWADYQAFRAECYQVAAALGE